MDELWKSAQFKSDDLFVMLTDKTGQHIGGDRVNVRTGRVEGIFRRGDVAINQIGDDAQLICNNWPVIELDLIEARELAELLQIDIEMRDD